MNRRLLRMIASFLSESADYEAVKIVKTILCFFGGEKSKKLERMTLAFI